MQINQIDVRAEVEFARAKLAHRQHAESANRARAVAEKAHRKVERGADTFVSQLRHRQRRLADAQAVEQIRDRHLHHHAAHELSEHRGGSLAVGRVDRGPLRAHRGDEAVNGLGASVEKNFRPTLAGE